MAEIRLQCTRALPTHRDEARLARCCKSWRAVVERSSQLECLGGVQTTERGLGGGRRNGRYDSKPLQQRPIGQPDQHPSLQGVPAPSGSCRAPGSPSCYTRHAKAGSRPVRQGSLGRGKKRGKVLLSRELLQVFLDSLSPVTALGGFWQPLPTLQTRTILQANAGLMQGEGAKTVGKR